MYNCIIWFKHKPNYPSISTMGLLQINLFFSLLLFWQWYCHNSIFFSLLSLPISAMRLSQFNFFLSPLLLFWHFNCHNLIFFSLFPPPILVMRLPQFNFFFSLLSPYILVSVGQLDNQARAKVWAANIFWQWCCRNYFFSLLSSMTSFFFPLLLFLTISVTILPKFISLFTQLNNFEQYIYHK